MRAIWPKRSQCYTPCFVVRNSPRYSILRSYSNPSVQGGLGPQLATVPNRAVLSVTGPEPNLSTFLNGLLSTHVVAPSCSETRKGFYSLFLSPQGRILYDIFLHPHPQESTGYLIEFDPRIPTSILSPNGTSEPSTTFPSLPKLLKRYILRSRTRVADVSDQYRVYAYWNYSDSLEPTGWRWSTSGSVEPIWNDAFDFMERLERKMLRSKGITGTMDLRAPRMGQRLIVPNEVPLPLLSRTPEVSGDDYTLHRIGNGVPEGMTDMADGLPMERNADMMGGVDFRKGCYVGQELTVRTYHTGLIRKRVVPVKLDPKEPARLESSQSAPLPRLSIVPVPVATAASKPVRPRGKGTLLSTIRTPSSTQHSMGLALLRLEHLEATEKEQISLEAQSSSDSHGNWGVVPLRPDWWPVRDD